MFRRTYTPEESEIYRTNTFGINCEKIKSHMKKPLKHDSPSQNKPIAFFIVGPPGSGKTYLLEHNLLPNTFNFDYYNVDEYYEPLLKLKKQGYNIHNLMTLAKQCIRIDYDEMVKNKKNIVLDRAGGRAKSILNQKKELEEKGYRTYMIAVYTPSNLSIERDFRRKDRTLGEKMVTKLWSDVMSNLLYYKEQFGENFILIDNSNNIKQIDPHPEIDSFNGYNISVSIENNSLNFKFARSNKVKGSIPFISIDEANGKLHEFLSK